MNDEMAKVQFPCSRTINLRANGSRLSNDVCFKPSINVNSAYGIDRRTRTNLDQECSAVLKYNSNK